MYKRKKFRILVRYLASECTDEERRKIERWISASRKNREFFESVKTAWEVSSNKSPEWDSKQAFKSFQSKLNEAGAHGGTRLNKGPKLYRIIPHRAVWKNHALVYGVGIAASVLLMIGSFYALSELKLMALRGKHAVTSAKDRPIVEEITTGVGQQVTLRFSDGTKVFLNAASKLRYVDNPQNTRDMQLDGEAYFEVNQFSGHPLVIHTEHAVVKDIGTKFDVRSWSEDRETRVIVTEGKVMVRPNHFNEGSVTVSHGQYSIIEPHQIRILPVHQNVIKEMEWVNGRLVFYDEPMGRVFKQLRRYYGFSCFAGDTSILRKTLTATFDRRVSSHEVLSIIALSLNVTYKVSGDTVLFVSTKPHLSDKMLRRLSTTENGFGRLK
jgi:transmembrane sensor